MDALYATSTITWSVMTLSAPGPIAVTMMVTYSLCVILAPLRFPLLSRPLPPSPSSQAQSTSNVVRRLGLGICPSTSHNHTLTYTHYHLYLYLVLC